MMYAITVATIMFAVTSSTGAFSLTYRFAAGAQRSLGRHVCRMATTAPSPEVSTPSSPAASAAGEHGANSLPIVTLERGKARIFQDGNPLVYGGAVKKVTGDARGGSFVTVHDHFGNSIGKGVFNPDSTYRVRMLTRATEVENSYDFPEIVETRLQDAVMLRRAINLPSQTDTAYRLVNGEGDRLSGLIVDVFNHVIVIQSSAVWVETHRDVIEEAMQRVFATVPKHMDEDGAARDYEVIWRRAESRLNQDGFTGDKSQEKTNIGEITVYENGVSYVVNLDDGQKTGFYCDQRENRQMIRQLSKGKTVLDTFSYTGGFGLNAALGGATSVTTVESSALACELINKNAALNGVSERVAAVKSDAVAFMRQEAEEHKTYDIVICDPPKLAPNRKTLDRAKNKYNQINRAALSLVKPGGLLLTHTCSAAMTQSGEFRGVIAEAAKAAKREVTILATSGAARDHPVHIAYNEGAYLTAILCHVK